MAYYSDDVINEVFSASDIIDYVSQYVQLKKNGRDYSGLCPFHKEKSPSFHVSADKQLFHCFGCGASGNTAQFIMRTENLDFVEALKLMADRAGIELPEKNYQDNTYYEKKQRFLEMNRIAARFFYDNLVKNPDSEKARGYLKNRGLSAKTITGYGLGFAPDGWDSLIKHLEEKGYSKEEICENSLAVDRDGKIYDKFRSRVMFPIINLRGQVIGFGGRIIEEKVSKQGFKPPKYLNSSETVCFSKGNNLFSLNFAKNTQSQSIILAEGYMDVISVYQAGIKNITATLGTAITENQAKLLMKYCREILICYDSDAAGTAAAKRAIGIINSVGGKARVINLGDVKDPDEFIKKYGAAAFSKAAKNAVPSTEYILSEIAKKYDINDTEDKIKFVNEAAEALCEINDGIEIEAYVKNISEKTDVSQGAIYSAIRKNSKTAEKRTVYAEKTLNNPPDTTYMDNKKNDVNNKITEAEKLLLSVIYKSRKLSAFAEENIPAEQYSSTLTKGLAEMIYSSWKEKKQPDPAVMASHFDTPEAAAVFYNMQVFDDETATVRELVRTIKTEKIQQEIRKETDPSRINELIKEKIRLREEI